MPRRPVTVVVNHGPNALFRVPTLLELADHALIEPGYPVQKQLFRDAYPFSYDLQELAPKDAVFVATGVTEGLMVNGVREENGKVYTQTLVLSSVTGMSRVVESYRPL